MQSGCVVAASAPAAAVLIGCPYWQLRLVVPHAMGAGRLARLATTASTLSCPGGRLAEDLWPAPRGSSSCSYTSQHPCAGWAPCTPASAHRCPAPACSPAAMPLLLGAGPFASMPRGAQACTAPCWWRARCAGGGRVSLLCCAAAWVSAMPHRAACARYVPCRTPCPNLAACRHDA